MTRYPLAALVAGCILAVASVAQADTGRRFASAEEPPVERPVFALNVNVAGALTFGPSLSLEVGDMVTFQALVRVPSAGLLNYVLAHEHSNWDDDAYDWGIGAGAIVRVYISRGMQGMRGFWLGAGAEYQLNAWRSQYYRDQVHGLVPWFQLGYRWIWDGFTFGVGASVGYRIELQPTWVPTPGCDSCGDSPSDRPYSTEAVMYLAHVELGFAL